MSVNWPFFEKRKNSIPFTVGPILATLLTTVTSNSSRMWGHVMFLEFCRVASELCIDVFWGRRDHLVILLDLKSVLKFFVQKTIHLTGLCQI